MRNKLKKAIASVVTIASLATCINGMVANAGSGQRTFWDGYNTATASLYASTTLLHASTYSNNSKFKTVDIYNYGYGTGYNHGEGVAHRVEAEVYGTGFTSSYSAHYSNGYCLVPDLYVVV